ncbi:MAG: glycosyltransferase [Deltaproteobacteria bacterium]|nr:glycosyltransferase [Deltaproteobacteria bacterium]
MLVRYKASTDDSVFCLIPETPPEKVEEEFFLSVAIQEHYINSHRADISNTLFSLPYPGYDLSALPMVQAADIINLHWVAWYQSPLTLRKLFATGKPVVWTLHDQWAFTGGCHYSAGCEEYCHGCADCPQLADDPFGLPAAVLKDKLRFFEDANLTIVTPSRWMADCARQSRLFKDLRVEVIPNSLETDVFSPQPKLEAKESIGIAAETITILFGGEDSSERRKGFRELKAVIKYCLKDARFQNLVKNDRIKMICFGRLSDELEALGIPVVQLGYLDSDEKISAAYSSADIFILPSLEDNLPNTMLEAMSCGTPVVAFDVGGMPDGIINGVTGQLVPMGDVKEMGKAILSLMFNTEQREWMGKECRKKVEEQYRIDIQAQRYLELYQELIDPYASTAEATSEDHASSLWQIPVPSKERPLSVTLEPGVGSHFKDIYDQILFKALKEFSCYAQEQWETSESDRAARLEMIEELGEKLEASESDRAARLEMIEELGEKLEASEADRAARLEDMDKLGKQLEESESDRTVRGELIEKLSGLLKASKKDRATLVGHVEKLSEEPVELIQAHEEIFTGSLVGILRHRRRIKKRMSTKSVNDASPKK